MKAYLPLLVPLLGAIALGGLMLYNGIDDATATTVRCGGEILTADSRIRCSSNGGRAVSAAELLASDRRGGRWMALGGVFVIVGGLGRTAFVIYRERKNPRPPGPDHESDRDIYPPFDQAPNPGPMPMPPGPGAYRPSAGFGGSSPPTAGRRDDDHPPQDGPIRW